ncbi:MAG: GTPase Era [Arenicella sp.]
MSKDQQYRFGFVALLGRPNVGKSTLLNRMVGKKISITSDRPQTTRHRILGIVSDKNKQIVFVDTPGVHSISQKTQKKRINKIINRTAVASIDGVDLVLFMVTAKGWKPADEVPLKALQDNNVPVIVVINKLDLLANKNQLLPQIEDLQQRINCVAVIPVSASKGNNVQHLMDEITSRLPEGQAHFDSKQITDRTQSFLVSEMIREQLFRLLGDELPYATAVELQRIELVGKTYHIGADIWVDKASQKAIVIGKQGAKLKQIGSKSRLPIQQLLGKKVFLELYVKVRSGWADRQQDLQSLGYDEGQ